MASLPYPRRPLRVCSGLRCTNRALVHQHCNPPTEFTEFTEASGGEEPPTDAHRCPQMVRLRRALPRNSRNSQKLLAEKSLPQMCTDAHRWLGCVGFSHGIHGIHRSFWRRRASHRCHRCPQMVRLRRVLPRNSRNTQKLLAEKSLPQISQISQISQMVRLRRVLWEDSFVVAWVWQGCHTLL